MWFVDLYRAYFINPSRFQVVYTSSTGPALLGVFVKLSFSWDKSQMLVVVGQGV